jgi:hypothetical protein
MQENARMAEKARIAGEMLKNAERCCRMLWYADDIKEEKKENVKKEKKLYFK